VLVRPLEDADRDWVREHARRRWGGERVVSRGRVREVAGLAGFAAIEDGRPVGLLTYAIEDGDCEVVTLDSEPEGRGAGSAVVAALAAEARRRRWRRVWLVTTNDNLRALRFYQRRGFRLAALYAGALEESRRLKPSIPLVGMHGIPLRDELELELDPPP
jgi:ribosomal protein S18 acetylase RimI-like enzyme